MTDYNDGEWHLWDGRECPVHPRSLVEFIYHDEDTGKIYKETLAAGGATFHDPVPWQSILKFRVLREYKERTGPQEVWLREYETFAGTLGALHQCEQEDEGARLFREVIDK